jgi:hypothetical protein
VAIPKAPPEVLTNQPSALFVAAQERAPSLTREFCDEYGLTDKDLSDIASGLVPPPPTIGPIHTVDLHRTDGGWQITPVGVSPGDISKGHIHNGI